MLTQTRSRCYGMDGSLLQNFKKKGLYGPYIFQMKIA